MQEQAARAIGARPSFESLLAANAGRLRLAERLGWLNCWTPLNADGFYVLNLANRDERVVAEILVKLSVEMPGESWLDTRLNGSAFSPPDAWASEVPRSGILSLTYYAPPERVMTALREQLAVDTLHADRFDLAYDD